MHCRGLLRVAFDSPVSFVLDIAGVVRDLVGNLGDFMGGDIGSAAKAGVGGERGFSNSVSRGRSRALVDFDVVREA